MFDRLPCRSKSGNADWFSSARMLLLAARVGCLTFRCTIVCHLGADRDRVPPARPTCLGACCSNKFFSIFSGATLRIDRSFRDVGYRYSDPIKDGFRLLQHAPRSSVPLNGRHRDKAFALAIMTPAGRVVAILAGLDVLA